ncbi:MAG: TetR/AcrR family transcriptional regulator [Panacagrimonas sp.]
MNRKRGDGGDEVHALDHLFEVSARLFAERGFDGVSVREISRASGFSMAAIYHHFSSKEGLFAEVSLHKYEDFADAALQRIATHRTRYGKATSVALAFFDIMIEDEDLFRLLQRDLIVGRGGQPHFRSRPQYQQLSQFIDQLLGFTLDDPSSEMKSFSLSAVINGYCELAMAASEDAHEHAAVVTGKYRHYLEQFVTDTFDTKRG